MDFKTNNIIRDRETYNDQELITPNSNCVFTKQQNFKRCKAKIELTGKTDKSTIRRLQKPPLSNQQNEQDKT